MTPINSIFSQEEKLIRLAKEGDQEAFGQLVDQYQDQVYTLACRTLGDPVRAKDVAQEAFIRAWRGIPRFKEESKFSSWLYRITVNACLSEHRKSNKPVSTFEQSELEMVKPSSLQGRHFESEFEDTDLIERLIACLEPTYRSIVTLFYVQDLSCNEISEILGHPVGTVKAYLHRARAQMKKHAEENLNLGKTT